MTIGPVSPLAILSVGSYIGDYEIVTAAPHGIASSANVVIGGCLDSGGASIAGLTGTFSAIAITTTSLYINSSYVNNWVSGGSVWVQGSTVSAATMTGFDSKLATLVTDKTGDVISGAYVLSNASLAMSIKAGGILQANAVGAEVVTSGNAHFELGDTSATSPSPGWSGDDVLLQPTRSRAINVSCTETFCEWHASYLPCQVSSIQFSTTYGVLVTTTTPHGLTSSGQQFTFTDTTYSYINNTTFTITTYGDPDALTASVVNATQISLYSTTWHSGTYGAQGTLTIGSLVPAPGNPTNRIGAVATGGFFSNIGLPGVYGIAGTGPAPVQSFYLPLTRLHHGASLLSATLYFFPITSLFSTAVPLVPTVFPTFQIYRTNFTGAPVPLASSGPAVFATPKSSAAYQATPALGSSGSFTLATLNSGPAAISAGQQLTDPAGYVFQVSTSGTYANGASVPIAAVVPTGTSVFYGANTNDTAGTILTWSSAPTNCKPTQVVAAPGLLGGLNAGYAQTLVFTPDADNALIDQSTYAYVAVWTGDNATTVDGANASPTVFTSMKLSFGGITCMAPQ